MTDTSDIDTDLAVPALRPLSAEDRAALEKAVRALERPSLTARLSGLIGGPLERLGQALPSAVSDTVARAVEGALSTALRVAVTTLPKERRASSGLLHKALAATSGAVGGAFGMASLAVELPVSTTIMLRGIADIARREGEDPADPETALACLQVFALGGRSEADDPAESGYFAVRGALAKTLSQAARYVTERGLTEEGAPILVRLTAQIASRFGGVVSQKVAAQAVPVLGALGGAAVNTAFMSHFQTVAEGHFVVRRLERTYGKDVVRAAYEEILAKGPSADGFRPPPPGPDGIVSLTDGT